MKTILLIHDATAASHSAAELAVAIAEHTGANLLLANLQGAGCASAVNEYVPGFAGPEDSGDTGYPGCLLNEPALINEKSSGNQPDIRLLAPSVCSAQELAALVRKENISMMVKGFGEEGAVGNLDLRTILNRVGCPVLLVPANYEVKNLDRIVYITDLRYCKPAVLRYLVVLAKGYQSGLSVAHLSASGLAHPVEAFASSLFDERVRPQLQYDRLDYHLIRERDVRKAVDVLIHGMQTELVVLENHQFHFEEIFGYSRQSPELSVPVLIFPG